MKFRIWRASTLGDNKQPCEGAVWSVTDGCFTSWSIEIADLDALVELARKEGELIVTSSSIGIYDDDIESIPTSPGGDA